jgi:hypothetical protein
MTRVERKKDEERRLYERLQLVCEGKASDRNLLLQLRGIIYDMSTNERQALHYDGMPFTDVQIWRYFVNEVQIKMKSHEAVAAIVRA